MSESTAAVNGIEICYETFGDRDGPPLLLIMGLGAQLLSWDVDLCEGFADRGFFVIRYDNRDVGLSSKIDGEPLNFIETFLKAQQGEPVSAPYLLSDMAADAVGLLDHLDIAAAHVVGASMGGMIAQTVAIEHPDRVLTLTSIMSTTGELEFGQATPEALATILNRPAPERDAVIEWGVETSRTIGSPTLFDEARARAKAAANFDRSYYPIGVGRQLIAIAASGSRADGLRALQVPTLVIHGTADPLVTISGGRRTVELVAGAELLEIEEMGHDLPPALWAQTIDAVTRHTSRAVAAGGQS
jgi:pimeloyl-ACP methyl ester carboxylesterase